MKKRCFLLILSGVLLFVISTASQAGAQTPAATADSHVAAAKAITTRPGQDFTYVFNQLCSPPRAQAAAPANAPAQRTVPPRSEWFYEPVKVFDNLYHVGSDPEPGWVVSTSAGLILIDTSESYSVEELVVNGLKKLGLDPANIKYIVVTAAHTDHYAGAPLLVERYHPRVLMSEADWNVLAKANVPAAIKPKKDMVISDGQKLTLGDTTITFYLTPGHTPGMVSMLIPLKDGSQSHLGGLWGGLGFGDDRDGVKYFPNRLEMLKKYESSAKRFWDIEAKAGVDVLITNHTRLDKGLEKMAALKNRKAGSPHPFVGKDAVQRFMTVLAECTEAQLAWLAEPSKRSKLNTAANYAKNANGPRKLSSLARWRFWRNSRLFP